MSPAPLPDVVLYSRPGCHLCEDAHAMTTALLDERRAQGRPVPRLVERDIELDRVLHDAFFTTIPVVEIGDRRIELVTSRAKLRRFLDEVLDAEALGASS